MKPKQTRPILLLFMFIALCSTAYSQTRELKRMKGYTIIDVATVSKVIEVRGGDKLIQLDNGLTFNVESLLLAPLTFTDVIIFAKPFPPELRRQQADKLPESMLYSYKLLIDREIHDATPYVSRR